MKLICALAVALIVPTMASAGCIGTGAFSTCNDSNGNSYTVNRFGNTTMMQGHNSNTGSSWSQNSQRVGNTTFHNGQTNGNSWNMQQNNFGSMQTYSGTNSDGDPFNYTCSFGSCN